MSSNSFSRWLVVGIIVLAVGPAACRNTATGPSQAPVVTSVSPNRAQIGETIVVTGSGFSAAGNAIKIGEGYLLGVPSADGTTLRFALPAYLGVCPPSAQACVQIALPVSPGTYLLSVVTDHGTSNAVPFTNIQT